MKKITVNIKAYIKSVVDLEEKILWTKTPNISIPQLTYPKMRIDRITGHSFFEKMMQEMGSITNSILP